MVASAFAVDPSSDEPLYRQVKRVLEQRILSGGFDDDQPLPSSRQLAAELGLSRNTINAAYQELIAQGIVETRTRSGMYVNAPMVQRIAARQARTEVPPVRYPWAERLGNEPLDEVPEHAKDPAWRELPYNFVSGQADMGAFPISAWLWSLKEALYKPHLVYSLSDMYGEDDPLLVEMIRTVLLPTRGIEADIDSVLITLGTTHALNLLAQALVTPGMTVAVENPGKVDARHVFARAGASLVPVPVDHSGLVPSEHHFDADLIYLTPSHQNPTSVTLSLDRRKHILETARERGCIVIEDDDDSELRYEGKPSPAMRAFDTTDQIAYVSAFSKFLASGLRIGYVVAAPELIERMRDIRRYTVRHPPSHEQRALGLMLDSGRYMRHLREYRERLKAKWETLTEAIHAHFPFDTYIPTGGVSLWVEGPSWLDSRKLARLASDQGVFLEPGDAFFVGDDPPPNYFRLGFSSISPSRIEEGVRRIAQVIPDARRD